MNKQNSECRARRCADGPRRFLEPRDRSLSFVNFVGRSASSYVLWSLSAVHYLHASDFYRQSQTPRGTALENGSIYHSQEAPTKRQTASHSILGPRCCWEVHYRSASSLSRRIRRPGSQRYQPNTGLQNLHHRVREIQAQHMYSHYLETVLI
jgi:hypothetical protein